MATAPSPGGVCSGRLRAQAFLRRRDRGRRRTEGGQVLPVELVARSLSLLLRGAAPPFSRRPGRDFGLQEPEKGAPVTLLPHSAPPPPAASAPAQPETLRLRAGPSQNPRESWATPRARRPAPR